MLKLAFTYLQYALPQHLITKFMGWLANSRTPWIKNTFINQFMKLYNISLDEAIINDPAAFPSFNDFFIRALKPSARPIASGANDIACPVDGTIAQLGPITNNQLLQAKNMYFNLETLFGNDSAAAQFMDGTFATLYLAPNNYHRIHMPVTGKLIKTIYIPGRLFSVNRMTSQLIPNLYARNERLICLFETEAGPMAVILVGAMIVGSISTAWMSEPIRSTQIITQSFTSNAMTLKKGEELGYFSLGSTVILLFSRDKMHWQNSLQADTIIQLGQHIGNYS